MKRWIPILLFLPTLLAATLWTRSYWRFDFASARGWHTGSEFGAIYAFYSGGGAIYINTGIADAKNRLETETGTQAIPWLPLRTWTNNGDRYWAVQWWAITAVCAAAAWWAWRHRYTGVSGFEVTPVAGSSTPRAPTSPSPNLSPHA